jgi:hypothetical protein
MIKKRQSEVNTSTSHREFQRKKDKTGNKGPGKQGKKKHKCNMNNSASLTPV